MVSSSESNDVLVQLKLSFVLFSNLLQYQYTIEETGKTFTRTKYYTKDAYEEYNFFKSVNALTSELDQIECS